MSFINRYLASFSKRSETTRPRETFTSRSSALPGATTVWGTSSWKRSHSSLQWYQTQWVVQDGAMWGQQYDMISYNTRNGVQSHCSQTQSHCANTLHVCKVRNTWNVVPRASLNLSYRPPSYLSFPRSLSLFSIDRSIGQQANIVQNAFQHQHVPAGWWILWTCCLILVLFVTCSWPDPGRSPIKAFIPVLIGGAILSFPDPPTSLGSA